MMRFKLSHMEDIILKLEKKSTNMLVLYLKTCKLCHSLAFTRGSWLYVDDRSPIV